MNRINYAGPIFNTGTTIRGFDFGGRARKGAVVEYYAPGGWYAVRVNAYGDTATIKVETAKAAS